MIAVPVAHAATLSVEYLSPPPYSTHLIFRAESNQANKVTVLGKTAPLPNPIGNTQTITFNDLGHVIAPAVTTGRDVLTYCAFTLATATCLDGAPTTEIHLRNGNDTLTVDLSNRRPPSWIPSDVELYGQTGNDTFHMRDTYGERVWCGDGWDVVEADVVDQVEADCEVVTLA